MRGGWGGVSPSWARRRSGPDAPKQSVVGIDARSSSDTNRAPPTSAVRPFTANRTGGNTHRPRTTPLARKENGGAQRSDVSAHASALSKREGRPGARGRPERSASHSDVARHNCVHPAGRATGGRGRVRARTGLRRNRVAPGGATQSPARPCSRCRSAAGFRPELPAMI